MNLIILLLLFTRFIYWKRNKIYKPALCFEIEPLYFSPLLYHPAKPASISTTCNCTLRVGPKTHQLESSYPPPIALHCIPYLWMSEQMNEQEEKWTDEWNIRSSFHLLSFLSSHLKMKSNCLYSFLIDGRKKQLLFIRV